MSNQMTDDSPTIVSSDSAKEFYESLRPAVRQFALLMETKLRAKDGHKKDWINCHPVAMLEDMKKEVQELEDALANGEGSDAVSLEAADVANFGLIIADLSGGLRHDHTPIGSRRS